MTAQQLRGRVIGLRDEALLVRTRTGDVEVPGAGQARPGDLVEVTVAGGSEASVRVVRAHAGGDYPAPGTELARLAGERMRNLERRARLLGAVRAFFDARGFLEVDTPLCVPAPGLELHLRAVRAGEGDYLITSPEFQMKRLLTAGLERIYTVCKCFRAGEEGAQHASEFTMLEWYRAWSELEAILVDTEALVAAAALAVAGTTRLAIGGHGRVVDVAPPWPRLTVAEAMERHAGVRVDGDEDAAVLAERARAAGVDPGAATAWDDIFYTAFVSRVEPALARMDRPVVLLDWPVRLAALAQRKPDDARVVERFEVYVGGVELANAYGELTDAAEQRARLEADRAERLARGLPCYPLDEAFLAALEEGLPPCAGIALGVDRLAMLVTGAAHIRDVLAFTRDEL